MPTDSSREVEIWRCWVSACWLQSSCASRECCWRRGIQYAYQGNNARSSSVSTNTGAGQRRVKLGQVEMGRWQKCRPASLCPRDATWRLRKACTITHSFYCNVNNCSSVSQHSSMLYCSLKVLSGEKVEDLAWPAMDQHRRLADWTLTNNCINAVN